MKKLYTMDSPVVVDLFCGAGGFSLGAVSLGFRLIKGYDKDSKSISVWNKNFDGTGKQENLLNKCLDEFSEELPENVDCVLASPPCKSVSVANRVNNRPSKPIPYTGNLISEIEPSFFIFENVPNLKWTYKSQLDAICDDLDDKYHINGRLLNAADYGVPQHRVRYILIGVREDILQTDELRFPKPTHGKYGINDHVSLSDALNGVESPTNPEEYRPKSDYYELLKNIPPSLNYTYYTEKRGHPTHNSNGEIDLAISYVSHIQKNRVTPLHPIQVVVMVHITGKIGDLPKMN